MWGWTGRRGLGKFVFKEEALSAGLVLAQGRATLRAEKLQPWGVWEPRATGQRVWLIVHFLIFQMTSPSLSNPSRGPNVGAPPNGPLDNRDDHHLQKKTNTLKSMRGVSLSLFPFNLFLAVPTACYSS